MRAAALAALPQLAAGHGGMLMPPSWFMEKGAPGTCPTKTTDWSNGQMWYTNNTRIPGDPTLPENDPRRTYPNITAPSYYGWGPHSDQYPGWAPPHHNHPWRAPGSAPTAPCGSEGGNANGCVHEDGTPAPCDVGGDGHGRDAVAVYKSGGFKSVVTTEWTVGSVVETAWSFWSNHGGGYSFRLCPKSQPVTEECFQAHPLDFVGNEHIIQMGANKSSRFTIPAMYFTDGTTPKGSMWSRLPIPACAGADGGYVTSFTPPAGIPKYMPTSGRIWCETYPIVDGPTNGRGLQFPAPFPGGYGWGNDMYGNNLPFNIVDKIQLPKDLPAGEYTLGFRWDVEQGAQIWNTCADVRLVDHVVEASAAKDC